MENTVIDIKPHVSEKIMHLLDSAHEISVTGIAREENSGFVNRVGYRVMRPLRITVDGTTYLVQ